METLPHHRQKRILTTTHVHARLDLVKAPPPFEQFLAFGAVRATASTYSRNVTVTLSSTATIIGD